MEGQEDSNSIQPKNIIIAIPSAKFAEGMKAHLQLAGFKVVDIVVVLEHLIESIVNLTEKGMDIYGVLISSDLSKKIKDKRHEDLADHLLAIRDRFSNIQFVFLSSESEGHPLLAEMVQLGIYNIFIKSSKSSSIENISDLTNAFLKSKLFSEVSHLRIVDESIPWRRMEKGPKDLKITITKDSNQSTEVREKIIERDNIVEKEIIVEREVVVEKIVEVPKEVIRVVKEVVEVETFREVSIPKKIILIGSLYPGAGSSFVALALARILSHIGISNAVVEHPVVIPSLHTVLYGEKNAPENYSYISEEILNVGRANRKSVEWKDGTTVWYPIRPTGLLEESKWSKDMTFKMLYDIKESVVLMDVSHEWMKNSIDETCLEVDEIVFVVDSLLSQKYRRPDTSEISKLMLELKATGKSVHIIANRDVPLARKRKLWLGSLPFSPEGVVPDINYQNIVESAWEGELVFDQAEIREELADGLSQLIDRLVPANFSKKKYKSISQKLRNGIFSFMKS
ncbi:hypothetical protein [Paenibacillus sp. FSL L8-0709]|uniref:hypothetical protein n=1 Tax=Paenibacillus sp. FSL L8-0709 TaxID=2975312 RepID=UPI0030F8E78D